MSLSIPSAEVTDPVLLDFAKEVGATGPVSVIGTQSRWHLGGPLAAGTRTLSAPAGIVDYQPEEMMVRVRAGTKVAELDTALRKAGQQTALPKRSGTVGGALAVGENCLPALGRGRIRTSLLQVRYVSADGLIVTGGGTTVKNVSGFDLPRLMVGSLGTLGLIAEVLLRTNPVPEVAVLAKSDDADPFEVFKAILKPNMILWDGTTTWVELIGNRSAVAAEAQKLSTMGTFSETVMPPRLPSHRWSLKPSELSECGKSHDTGPFVASIGVGTVFGSKRQPTRELTPGIAAIHARMKAEFDPTGRLNPGRVPGVQ